MNRIGARFLAGVVSGVLLALPGMSYAQTPVPAQGSPRSAAAAPTEARAKAVSASTIKQMAERYTKGFNLTYVLARQFDQDLPSWRVAAGKDDPAGLLALGMCNYYGIGGKQNRDRGFELIKKAADAGHVEAMAVLGIVLQHGDLDHAPQKPESTALLTKASKMGSNVARDALAISRSRYLRTIGNMQAADEMLQKAVDQGSLNAQTELASIVLIGWMRKFEPEAAVAMLESAGKQGCISAMNLLADIYAQGVYAEMNPLAAQRWIEAAASTGDIEARMTLASMLESGRLTGKQQTAQAAEIWREIARSTEPKATLAIYFRNRDRFYPNDAEFKTEVFDRVMDAARRGTPEAYVAASRLLRRDLPFQKADLEKSRRIIEYGADAMDRESIFELGLANRYGYFEPANDERAMEQFKAAAALGKAEAMSSIALRVAQGRGVKYDPVLAHELYLVAAFAGDPEAMYAIASDYTYGSGVKQSAERAELWAKRAVMHGNNDGFLMLFELRRLGVGSQPNLSEGIKFLMTGASSGGRMCVLRYGEMLIEGRFVPRDVERGIKLLEAAVPRDRDGSIRAVLAERYYHGGLVPQNPARAFKLAKEAADLNNADAWSILGELYAFGLGVEADWTTAVDCYSKAISLGNLAAMVNLGRHYLEGKVTPRDVDHAVELWSDAYADGNRRAAMFLTSLYLGTYDKTLVDEPKALEWAEKGIEAGYSEACIYVGQFYSAREDYISARKWVNRGIELGNSDCYNELGVFYRFGRGVEQNYEEAAKNYRKAFDAGNMTGASNLAWCYETGNGVEKNLEESMRLSQLAADNGEPNAMLFIGRKYIDGIGVPRDFEKGMEWVQKAANAGNVLAKNMIDASREKGLIK